MKILFVLHQYLPRHVTGTEQYARSLALALRARGHDVHVLAYEPLIQYAAPGRLWFEQDETVEGVPVHRFSVHPEFSANRELGEIENPLVAGMFTRWFGAHDFDLVHVFHARNIGSAALLEPARRGVPVVVHLMDFWFLCPNFLLLRRSGELCDGPPDGGFGCVPCMDPGLGAEVDRLGLRAALLPLAASPPPPTGLRPTPARRAHALVTRKQRLFDLLAGAAAVIAPSRFLRERFEAQGFPAGVIRHLPYGLDASRFAGAPARPRGAQGGPLRLGYVGSISEHKGVHVAIAAVRARPDLDVRLSVRGGLESHPEYSARLQTLAGDDVRIEFAGRFEPDQLGAVLADLDAVVAPSLWYENTPFSVLEALHFGLPVLASDLGGVREIVQHGRNGLLVPAGDADALAAAMAELARDPALRQRLSAGAEVPDIADNVAELERVYAGLVRARAAGTA